MGRGLPLGAPASPTLNQECRQDERRDGRRRSPAFEFVQLTHELEVGLSSHFMFLAWMFVPRGSRGAGE